MTSLLALLGLLAASPALAGPLSQTFQNAFGFPLKPVPTLTELALSPGTVVQGSQACAPTIPAPSDQGGSLSMGASGPAARLEVESLLRLPSGILRGASGFSFIVRNTELQSFGSSSTRLQLARSALANACPIQPARARIVSYAILANIEVHVWHPDTSELALNLAAVLREQFGAAFAVSLEEGGVKILSTRKVNLGSELVELKLP